MSPVSYYKLCLGWPLLLPGLLIVILPGGAWPGGPNTALGVWVILWIGGLPYLMTILPLLGYGWDRDFSWWRNLLFVLPIIYAVVLGLSAAVFFAINTKTFSLSWSEHEALVLARPVLVVGYPYVGLCYLGLFVLRRLGVIKEA
jgi:hypothetical protein